jgi:stage II sporulation protein D
MMKARLGFVKRRIIGYIAMFVNLIILAYPTAFAAPADDITLRIGLIRFFKSVRTVTISAADGISIRSNFDEQPIISTSKNVKAILAANLTGISVEADGRILTLPRSILTITPNRPEEPLCVESPTRPTKQYRGSIEVSLKGDVLSLVNVVRLEDYVRGVLPEEMPTSYPMESLKAQAVAARTYALANIGKHGSEGYDLCDTNLCQQYGGASVENAKCSKAVDETSGILLVFNGHPANVLYSADCGGVTQDYSESYPGKSIPYLCAVKEPTDIEHSSWELVYSLKELEDKLVKAGIDQARGLCGIRVTKTSSSGRALELEITGIKGTALVSGTKFRSALGSCTLKSMLFTLEATADGGVIIRGKGWGHGHGMCQVGAKGLALPPYNYTYDQILAHYFPGTVLQTPKTPVQTLTQRLINANETPPSRIESPPHKGDTVCLPSDSPTEPANKSEELKLKVRLKPPDRL